MNNFWKKNKVWIVIIGVVLLIIFLGYWKGDSAYSYAKDYLNLVEKDQLQKIEVINDSLLILSEARKTKIKDLEKRETTIINNYYDEFIKEKNRANKLEAKINAIYNLLYSKSSLDSLAEHARYPR
jgi:hypothetical protein